MEKSYNKNTLLLFILLIVTIVGVSFSAENFVNNKNLQLKIEHSNKVWDILSKVLVTAKAVSIYDATEDKKIYGKNDAIAMPIASIAKIMTVLVSLNKYDEDSTLSISEDAIKQDGDFGIFSKETWKVGDLAKLTLVVSANDGAFALSEKIDEFVEQMNTKAQKIGMENTLFLNSTGLDVGDPKLNLLPGAMASAEDVNKMALYANRARPDIFSATRFSEINLESESGFVHNIKNTNTIVDKIPNLILSKTGYTGLSAGNLVVIFQNKNNHTIAVTVLGSTYEGRFTDMENIINTLYFLD